MSKLKMNKRGQEFLTEEMIHILIGTLCVSLLFFGVYSFLTNTAVNEKIKQAEASKGVILGEIDNVDGFGDFNGSELLIPNPAGWFIFSFADGDLKPNACASQNCVCICEEAIPAFFDWQEKRCDEKGSCIPVDNIKKFDKIKIENNGVWILINKVNEKIEIRKK